MLRFFLWPEGVFNDELEEILLWVGLVGVVDGVD